MFLGISWSWKQVWRYGPWVSKNNNHVMVCSPNCNWSIGTSIGLSQWALFEYTSYTHHTEKPILSKSWNRDKTLESLINLGSPKSFKDCPNSLEWFWNHWSIWINFGIVMFFPEPQFLQSAAARPFFLAQHGWLLWYAEPPDRWPAVVNWSHVSYWYTMYYYVCIYCIYIYIYGYFRKWGIPTMGLSSPIKISSKKWMIHPAPGWGPCAHRSPQRMGRVSRSVVMGYTTSSLNWLNLYTENLW